MSVKISSTSRATDWYAVHRGEKWRNRCVGDVRQYKEEV